MNHQTAKIIAESYSHRAQDLRKRVGTGDNFNPKMFQRVMAMDDHAAVWERVVGVLKPAVIDWHPAHERPSIEDANANGDVVWMRSGVEMLGRYDRWPVDATKWRRVETPNEQ